MSYVGEALAVGDVGDHRAEDVWILSCMCDGYVAAIAEKASNSTGCVTVINHEIGLCLSATECHCRQFAADSAPAVLILLYGVKLI